MDILISVIISGMAVSYVVGFIASLAEGFFSPRIVKMVLTIPLSFMANWYLDITGFTLVVSGLATAFASLVLLMLTSRPVQVINTSRR
jgi:hypothetical protein